MQEAGEQKTVAPRVAADGETTVSHARVQAHDVVLTAIAALGLLIVFALAFFPAVQPTLADRVTLLVLGIVAIVCFWTPLQRIFEVQQNAATFAITAALFIVYSLARRAGPEDGWALRFAALPEDQFEVSYAARVVLLCALVTAPTWWRRLTGWTRAVLTVTALIGLLTVVSFLFLGRYYTVGPVEEVVDPTPLPHLGMQLLEYGALALLCNVVSAHPKTRRVALRVLPILLLALWARHQFAAAPPPAEEGEESEEIEESE